ncbi:MAG: 50S ribosomal protein L35 [Spirochaetaceae bacterium]
MSKMKTRKSAAKRFRVTGNGKIKYKKMGLRHILTKKSRKTKRNLRKAGTLSAEETKKAKRLLPYSF